MGMKGFIGSLKSFTKNLSRHVSGVVTRKETRRDAKNRILADGKKLVQSLRPQESKERQKCAEEWLKKGTHKYNHKEYDRAEECFRRAVDEDPKCVAAVTYLGHTLYQKNMMDEALRAWKRAHEMDPNSPAGQKAMRKIQHVEKMQKDVLAQIRERLG
jgi:tetratricopeptide (TPR) repeat protein